MNRSNTLHCPYCRESSLIEDTQTGDIVCGGCGLVLGDRIIEMSPEWCDFTSSHSLSQPSNNASSRVGECIDSHGGAYIKLATKVGSLIMPNTKRTISVDVSMDKVLASCESCGGVHATNPNKQAKTDNTNGFRNRIYLSADEKVLVAGLRDIAEMGTKSNATEPIIATAQAILKELHTRGCLLRYRSNLCAASAACLFFAYRKHKVPRTLKELCAVAQTSVRQIGKMFSLIKQKLWLVEGGASVGGEEHRPTLVVDLLPRFLSRLHVPKRVHRRAFSLAKNIEQQGHLLGRNPTTIAALAIFLAVQSEGYDTLKEPDTQASAMDMQATGAAAAGIKSIAASRCLRHIAEETGAAETTIREVYYVLKAKTETND